MDLVPQSPVPIQGEVPQARLPLALTANLLGGLPEAAAETQVVSNGVFPAIWGSLEEWEVLSGINTNSVRVNLATQL